jgi:hypothetical protein
MNTLRPEPQTPEIQRELQALQETLNRLSVANDALADKLQPVLSIEQSEGFYAVAGSEPATPLGKFVRSLTAQAEVEAGLVNLLTASIAF